MSPLTTEEPRSDAGQSAEAGSQDRRERLTEARELVKGLDKSGRRLRRKLQDAMTVLPRKVELAASGKVAQLRREHEGEIAENHLDGLADRLTADLHEVQRELFEMLSRRLGALRDELRDELQEWGVELDVATLPERTSIEINHSDPGRKGIDLRDLLVGPPLAVVGVVTMNPILMAGGAGVTLIRGTQVFDRSRKERARKQVADISSDFQRQLSLALHQATVEARSSLASQLDDALESRRSELIDEIRSLEELPAHSSLPLPYRSRRLRDRC